MRNTLVAYITAAVPIRIGIDEPSAAASQYVRSEELGERVVATIYPDRRGEGYGIASPEVFALIAELARLEGLVLDPVYTGKAFAGMLSEIEGGRFEGCDDIVFVHTGGIFGLFPQADGFDWQQ